VAVVCVIFTRRLTVPSGLMCGMTSSVIGICCVTNVWVLSTWPFAPTVCVIWPKLAVSEVSTCAGWSCSVAMLGFSSSFASPLVCSRLRVASRLNPGPSQPVCSWYCVASAPTLDALVFGLLGNCYSAVQLMPIFSARVRFTSTSRARIITCGILTSSWRMMPWSFGKFVVASVMIRLLVR